jgi:hypothetical protein
MARPAKTTPKAVPCAVSLYPDERRKFIRRPQRVARQ